MLSIYIRTLLIIFIVELGSTSQFTLAAIASHSQHPWIVWLGGITALVLTSSLAIMAGNWMTHLPVSPNVISGCLMVTIGLFLLWKS